ncbi:MAG: hypothetical protein ACR2OO_15640 [Thermomicrobiales bacterium]
MSIEGFLNGNPVLGVLLLAVLATLALRNPAIIREITGGQTVFWRLLTRLALLSTVAFVVWTSAFDNWRQFVGIPYRASRSFPSERIEYDVPGHSVRVVTVVLLSLSLIFVAALFARYVGGYVLQPIVFVLGAGFWLPLFVIRQRLGIDLAMGVGSDATTFTDVLGYGAFLAVAWCFDFALIATSFLSLVGLTAIPVTLLLDLFKLRRIRPVGDASTFYASMGDRARSINKPPR